MTSLQISDFKHAIIDFTNRTDLPLEVKRLVFSEILREISLASQKETQMQYEQMQAEKQEESDDAKGDN